MEERTVSRVEEWESQSFPGGYESLRQLADGGFSGAVRTRSGTWAFLLNGRVIGVFEGSIEDFAEEEGTVHEAPHPSLPLLFAMLELGGEQQAKYYTNDTPISEAHRQLSDASFTGFIELSENVLSGDYYVVYYGGRSMSCAFVGNAERLEVGDEAFQLADDEVGIYEVRTVDLDVVEIPESSAGASDGQPAGGAAGQDAAGSDQEAGGQAEPSPGRQPGGVDQAGGPDRTGGESAPDQPASGSTPDQPAGQGASNDQPAGQEASADQPPQQGASAGQPAEQGASAGQPAERGTRSGQANGAAGGQPDEPAGGADRSAEPIGQGAGTGRDSRPQESTAPRRDEAAGTAPGTADDGPAPAESGGGTAQDAAGGAGRQASGQPTGGSQDASAAAGSSAEPATGGSQDASAAAGSSTEPATGGPQDASAAAGSSTEPATGGHQEPAGSRTQEPAGGGSQQSAGGRGTRERAGTQQPGTSGGSAAAGPTPVPAERFESTQLVPSLDPDRTAVEGAAESTADGRTSAGSTADDATGSGTAAGAGETTATSAGTSETAGQAAASSDAAAGGDPSEGTAASASRSPEEATGGAVRSTETEQSGGEAVDAAVAEGSSTGDLRAQLAEREERIEELEAQLADLRVQRDGLRDERDRLREEVEELEAEVAELREEVEDLRAQLNDGIEGKRRLDPEEALRGTNLFVRYGSKSGGTLEKAHAGDVGKEEVDNNLRLEHHTQFEADGVAVDGEPFDRFLDGSLYKGFVEWLVHDLLYEIRDTGHVKGLKDLYDALPQVDRAELLGQVAVEYTEDGEQYREQRTFDVVLRDRMGNPLVVADINDSRNPATREMMTGVIENASDVKASNESLASALLVTASFFEPGALEAADEAAGGGLLGGSSRESFVRLSRKQGYHLLLVETRGGEFHVNVPEL